MSIVTIHTRQRCKICNRPFKLVDLNVGFICKEHGTRPDRYFVMFCYRGKIHRLYLNQYAQKLSSFELAAELACYLSMTVYSSNSFDPADFFPKPNFELKACWDNYRCVHHNPNTLRSLNTAEKRIFAYFLPDKKIDTLSQFEINNFWEHLVKTHTLYSAKRVIIFVLACHNYHRGRGLNLSKLTRPIQMRIALSKTNTKNS